MFVSGSSETTVWLKVGASSLADVAFVNLTTSAGSDVDVEKLQ
jgi:hypothetical protein